VTASLSGAGNVALWPEPVIRLPPGFRSYSGETGMRVVPRDGRIAGTKVFHYLVMPDSAGSFLLPEVRYAYYDLAAGDYRAATIGPRALAVAPGLEPHAPRALPPLARPGGRPRALRRGRAGAGGARRRFRPEGASRGDGDRAVAAGRPWRNPGRPRTDPECRGVVRRGRAARRVRLVRRARGRRA